MFINLKTELKKGTFKRKEIANILNITEPGVTKRINGDTILKDNEKELIFNYLKTKGFSFTYEYLFEEKQNKTNNQKFSIHSEEWIENSSDLTLTLNHLIEEKKEKENISFSQIAKDLGIDDKTLRFWRQGIYEPRGAEMLNSLAKYFDVSIPYLLGKSSYRTSYRTTETLEKMSEQKEIFELICKYVFEYMKYYGFNFSDENNSEIVRAKFSIKKSILEAMLNIFNNFQQFQTPISLHIDSEIELLEEKLDSQNSFIKLWEELVNSKRFNIEAVIKELNTFDDFENPYKEKEEIERKLAFLKEQKKKLIQQ